MVSGYRNRNKENCINISFSRYYVVEYCVNFGMNN